MARTDLIGKCTLRRTQLVCGVTSLTDMEMSTYRVRQPLRSGHVLNAWGGCGMMLTVLGGLIVSGDLKTIIIDIN